MASLSAIAIGCSGACRVAVEFPQHAGDPVVSLDFDVEYGIMADFFVFSRTKEGQGPNSVEPVHVWGIAAYPLLYPDGIAPPVDVPFGNVPRGFRVNFEKPGFRWAEGDAGLVCAHGLGMRKPFWPFSHACTLLWKHFLVKNGRLVGVTAKEAHEAALRNADSR